MLKTGCVKVTKLYFLGEGDQLFLSITHIFLLVLHFKQELLGVFSIDIFCVMKILIMKGDN